MATANTSVTSSSGEFVTVPGDRRSEVARTLAEPVPQALSLLDQFGLWGNLGVSLLGFTGAIFVLQPDGAGTPELSLAAALTAIVAGTLLGTVPLALAGLPGAQTGAPAMVLLRGLFGARLSYLPTVLNILQCLGWGIFELVTIATAAHTLTPALPKWGYVLIAGVITALLTIRPLGAIRVLRRYATTAVLIVLCYLLVQLLRHPLPGFTHGTWTGYWAATDTVVAVAVSFAPLIADYSRHSRSPAGRLRRDAGRVQRHPGAVLRHRAAGAGHGRARQPERYLRRVHRAAGRRARLRRPRRPGARPGVRQRLLDGGVGAEPAPAVGPPDPGRRDRRRQHGRRAVAEHRRLRELPRPHRLGVRADVGRADRGLLRRVGQALGPVGGGPVAAG